LVSQAGCDSKRSQKGDGDVRPEVVLVVDGNRSATKRSAQRRHGDAVEHVDTGVGRSWTLGQSLGQPRVGFVVETVEPRQRELRRLYDGRDIACDEADTGPKVTAVLQCSQAKRPSPPRGSLGPAPMVRARRVSTSRIKRRSDNKEGDVR
jgi:hypothetical protein